MSLPGDNDNDDDDDGPAPDTGDGEDSRLGLGLESKSDPSPPQLDIRTTHIFHGPLFIFQPEFSRTESDNRNTS